MANNKTLLLELGKENIKAVLLQKRDNFISVIKAGSLPVNQKEPLTERLSDFLQGFPLENIIALYPRERCVFRIIEVKEPSREALKDAVGREIEEGLHYSRENTAYDAVLVSAKNIPGVKPAALFYATALDEIKSYFSLLQREKAFPVSVIPTSAALFEAFKTALNYTPEPSLLVFWSGGRADLLACKDGGIILSRALEIKKDDLAQEVELTRKALFNNGVSILKVFVSGFELKEGLQLEPGSQFMKEAGQTGQGADWLLLFGLYSSFIKNSSVRPDLIRNTSGKNNKAEHSEMLLKITVILTALLLLVFGVFYFLNSSALRTLEEAKADLAVLDASGGKKWSGLMKEVFDAVPNDIVLNEIAGDARGELTVKGSAKIRQNISDFVDRLNKIKGASSELSFANDLSAAEGRSTQFMIKLRIKVVAK